jgi:hypothetical protein
MALKDAIIRGIIRHIENPPFQHNGSWSMGLTCDLPAAYDAWGKPAGLFFWDADSLDDAMDIESFCLQTKGMQPLYDSGIDSGEPVRICICPRA